MKKFKRFINSQKVAPYVFVLPFILSFIIFWVYPLISTVVMSFQNVIPGQSEFIKFDNYSKLLKDKVFHTAVLNSLRYTVWTILLLIPVPMFLAVLMESKFVKRKSLWKSLLYLPSLVSVVVSGTLFRMLFSELPTAQMNQFLIWLGTGPIKWLKEPQTAMLALVTLACWKWAGVNMLYFSAGLKAIDKEYYEAASIDGASAWKQFRYITVPLIKPTTVYVVTISIYAGLAMFLESYMLWNGNSSPRNVGLTIVGYLYRRGIEKNQLGYASAVGLILFIIAMVINVTQLILNGSFKKEAK